LLYRYWFRTMIFPVTVDLSQALVLGVVVHFHVGRPTSHLLHGYRVLPLQGDFIKNVAFFPFTAHGVLQLRLTNAPAFSRISRVISTGTNSPEFRSLQALISNPSLWSPDAIDAVASKYSNWVARCRSRCCQSKLAFVAHGTSVREDFFGSRIDLACVFQQKGVCSVLVVGSATVDRLQSDDACVMCK
jgi:hypothetical protein